MLYQLQYKMTNEDLLKLAVQQAVIFVVNIPAIRYQLSNFLK